jgi:SAM-dependent methyltransferase
VALDEGTTLIRLDLADYARDADRHEMAALDGIDGPVLDVGCGPGRIVAELAARGIPAMGIDLAPRALELAAQRGAPMLTYSVFDRVPGEGRWPTVLLLDGNIGIGGDPVDLLRRVRQLLRPGGVAVVELEGPGVVCRREVVRLDLDAGVTGWLPWARVGVDETAEVAGAAGLSVTRLGREGTRWFGRLRRPRTAR